MKFSQVLLPSLCTLFLASPFVAAEPNQPAAAKFPVREGDVWVMVGDSITAQKLHTTYLEAFVRARYPKLKFAAINSGKNGDIFVRGVIRLRRNIMAYKPTLVSVEFGMNDHRYLLSHKMDAIPPLTLQRFGDTVKNGGARFLVFSPSPYNRPASWGAGPAYDAFVRDLKSFAARNNAPYMDQYEPLKVIWTANFPRDRAAVLRAAVAPFLEAPFSTTKEEAAASVQFVTAIRPLLDEQTFLKLTDAPPGTKLTDWLEVPNKEILLAKFQPAQQDIKAREELRQYFKDVWVPLVDKQQPAPVTMGGAKAATDLVHPGPAAQWMMAALLFREMGGNGLVSSVVIDAGAGKLVEAEGAKVRDISYRNGTLKFARLDDSLPLPIPPEAQGALSIDIKTAAGTPAAAFGMSRYLLTVKNLPRGRYELLVGDAPVTVVEADALAAGLDVGLLGKGAPAAQARRLLEAVTRNLVVAGMATEAPLAPPIALPEAEPQEHIWTLRALGNAK